MSDIEKKIPEEVQAQDVGSQADVEAIMKKYDRESNTRTWTGVPKMIIRYVFSAFMLFMIWMSLFAKWGGQIRTCVFLGCLVPFTLLIYPVKKGQTKENYMPWYDIVLAVVGAVPFFYYAFNLEKMIKIGTNLGTLEIVLAFVAILVVAECCRRAVGIPILQTSRMELS